MNVLRHPRISKNQTLAAHSIRSLVEAVEPGDGLINARIRIFQLQVRNTLATTLAGKGDERCHTNLTMPHSPSAIVTPVRSQSKLHLEALLAAVDARIARIGGGWTGKNALVTMQLGMPTDATCTRVRSYPADRGRVSAKATEVCPELFTEKCKHDEVWAEHKWCRLACWENNAGYDTRRHPALSVTMVSASQDCCTCPIRNC